MDIPEKLLKFKYHFIFGAIISLTISSVFIIAPRFLTILAYFWPLFLSTALVLVAVVVLGRISPPAVDKAGEGLLDYVAGQPEQFHESFISE
ncbi:hypothetical protein RJ641_000550 [Dillenia turbinata]|uniref:Transmembrane protein n=1 Tax=Dillenia turbinata TaxID=194707 RepID=A0AAN8WEU9_9MAGN